MISEKPKVAELLEVRVDSVAYGTGDGVARANGFVIFIPFAAPGDKLKVRVSETKSQFARAEIVEILEASAKRVKPACAVYGQCGGCQLQHLSYPVQIQLKQKLLGEFMRGFEMPVTFTPAPEPWHYRNRIQLQSAQGKRGFFRRESRDIVEFEECLIADSRLNQFLQENKHALPDEKFEIFLKNDQVKSRSVSRDLEIRPFSQVNPTVNSLLVKAVLKIFEKLQFSTLIELYCGSGNFTFELARQFPSATVIGIDISKTNIGQANSRLRSERTKNLRFVAGDAARELARLQVSKPAILVDPSRTGLDGQVRRAIQEADPLALVYVSCNPATLRRDLLDFATDGLKPVRIEGFDMFPQTAHLECVVEVRSS